MARKSFPIVGSFNVERIPKIDDQQLINLYEVIDQNSKKGKFLAPTPGYGLPVVIDDPKPSIRGTFVFKGFAYIVAGDSVYRVDSALGITPLSPPLFSTTTGPVRITSNEKQVIFTDGTTMLAYDVGTATLSLVNTGFIVADATSMDGYVVAIQKDSNKWHISSLNDVLLPSPWAPLDFALVLSAPTVLIGCQRFKRRLFLFGDSITEVWLDAGYADFPFRRDNNLLFEHGLGARGSLVEGFDRMFYLSKDEDGFSAIMMVTGTVPKPISNEAIELQIQDLTDPSDATAFVYRINGNIFYQINFTADNKTFVYNVTMGRWHTLEMLNGDRHTADTHMFFPTNNGTRHFIGSYKDPNIYELSATISTNNGEDIKRSRVCSALYSPVYNNIRIDRFMVDLLQGVGTPNPAVNKTGNIVTSVEQTDDPHVFLSISRDGGVTYENFGSAAVGKLGMRRVRTFWTSLGIAREHIIRIDFYMPLPYYVLGAAIDMEVFKE